MEVREITGGDRAKQEERLCEEICRGSPLDTLESKARQLLGVHEGVPSFQSCLSDYVECSPAF